MDKRGEVVEKKIQMESCEAVEEVLDEVEALLVELFQSGFTTIYDSTLKGMKEQSRNAEQIGLSLLSEMLDSLSLRLEQGRHQMNIKLQEMLAIYQQIYQYLIICRERTEIDKGVCYYG